MPFLQLVGDAVFAEAELALATVEGFVADEAVEPTQERSWLVEFEAEVLDLDVLGCVHVKPP